ncbi:MAG: hypothetical protein ACLQO7_11480 [Candidatus Bathyarchaeia archaeon]
MQSTNSSVPTGSGLLQASQFAAMQKFWTLVVENPQETNNVKVQNVLVLPENFGGGLRSQSDGKWGIWQANGTSRQVWSTLQSTLHKYGSKL